MQEVMAKLSDTFLRIKRPEVFERVGADADDAASSVDKVSEAFDKMMAKMGGGDPLAGMQGAGGKDKDKGAPSFVPWKMGLPKQLQEAADGFRDLAKAQKEAADAGSLDRVLDSLDQMPPRVDKMTVAMRIFAANTKKAMDDALGTAAIMAFDGFVQMLGNTLAGVQSLKDAFTSFGDLVKRILADMIAQFIKIQILKAAIGFAGGPFTKIGGMIWGFANSGGARMAKGGIVPSGFPNDTFNAQLTSGEVVMPLERLEAMMGSSRGGASRVQVEGIIRGSDIELVMSRRARRNYGFNAGARF
jgi:hypothetical protein